MKSWRILIGVSLAAIVELAQPLEAKVMTVGIRDGYLKSMEYKDVWSAAKAIGVDRVEVEVNPELQCPNLYESDGSLHQIDSPASINRLKNAFRKHQHSITASTAVIARKADKTPEQIQQWVTAAARVAQQLKVPVIMMPLIARGIEDDEFIKRAREYVAPLQAVAAQTR